MMSNNSSKEEQRPREHQDERNDKPTEQRRAEGSKQDGIQSPLKFTCTLCKKVILAVDVDHTIF